MLLSAPSIFTRNERRLPRQVDNYDRAGNSEFEDYLECGLLEHGFLRVKCDGCRHEHLVAFSCKRRGYAK
jgi:hypothetical protein